MKNEIQIYQSSDNQTKIEVRFEKDTCDIVAIINLEQF